MTQLEMVRQQMDTHSEHLRQQKHSVAIAVPLDRSHTAPAIVFLAVLTVAVSVAIRYFF